MRARCRTRAAEKPCRIAWLLALALSATHAQESTIVLGEIAVSSDDGGTLPAWRILTSVDVMGA